MTDDTVDALIADVDRGADPNAIRARAAALYLEPDRPGH